MQKSVMKYITNIGQNTGTLKTSKNVQTKPITELFVTEYQNLNSGNRRINGLNSSFALVGSSGPFSSAVMLVLGFGSLTLTKQIKFIKTIDFDA